MYISQALYKTVSILKVLEANWDNRLWKPFLVFNELYFEK